MITKLNLSLNDVVVQGTGNITSDMDGEKVLLSVQNGKYYNLGDIGGRIWELVETPKTCSEVVKVLTAEYEVKQKECEEQVLSFLEQLLKEGLIETGR